MWHLFGRVSRSRKESSMTQTVTALYDTHDDAVAAMDALVEAGIPVSDISIISSNADNRSERTHHAADDAKKGAGLGAAVGGLGKGLEATVGGVGATVGGLGKGLEATVGGLGKGLEATVGGVGATVGGLGKGLEATVGGVGATVGGLGKGLEATVGGLGEGLGETVGGIGELLTGLVGTLTSAGVPERDANIYAEGVRRGGTLVTARVADAQAPSAREIMQR
jgi:hypothetical protein